MKSKSILILWVLLLIGLSQAAPIGTAFTYQGELKQLGVAANGPFDFLFELFDIDTGGATIANTVLIEDVAVVDGVFTVELDFGSVPFVGDQLWLEIGVREGASNASHVNLSPRQMLNAVPYAQHAERVSALTELPGGGNAHPGDFSVQANAELLDIDQSSGLNISGSTDQWQSFTPATTGLLTRLDLRVSSPILPASSPGTIRIYEGEGTGGNLLATESVTLMGVLNTFQNFTIANPPALTGGAVYTYRLTVPDIQIGWVYLDIANPYVGGRASFDPGWDFRFRTHMTSTVDTFLVADGIVDVRDVLHLVPRSSAPALPEAGDMYYDSTLEVLRYYNGLVWIDL